MMPARFLYLFIQSGSCAGGAEAAPCSCYKQQASNTQHRNVSVVPFLSGFEKDVFDRVYNKTNIAAARKMI